MGRALLREGWTTSPLCRFRPFEIELAGNEGYLSLWPTPERVKLRSMSRNIVIAAFRGVQVLDVSGPAAVFQAAAQARPSFGYQVEVVASEAGPLATDSGMSIVAERSFSQVRGVLDT